MTSLLALILACAPTVAPRTVQMLIDTESHGQVLALNVNGHRLKRQPSTVAEAQAWAAWLTDRGYNVDAGLMQVNSANWSRLGLDARSVFEPCRNIRAGAQILTEGYERASRHYGPGQRSLWAAVSAYNTGSLTAGFKNGYVPRAARAAGVDPPNHDRDELEARARVAPPSFVLDAP